MEILKFKTNINCGSCVATVTPFLNKEESIQNWQVNTSSADKVLTVSGHEINPQNIKNIVEQAGFKAHFLQVLGVSGNDL